MNCRLSPSDYRPPIIALILFFACFKPAFAQWDISYKVSPDFGTETTLCDPYQSVTRTKTVTATATVEWKGAAPPPKKLTVRETATVSWYAEIHRPEENLLFGQMPIDPGGSVSGECHTGLGDQNEETTFTPNPQTAFNKGENKTGKRITSYDVVNGVLVLPSVTLTATATASSGDQYTTGGVVASCTRYDVSLIEIQRDGQSLGGDYAQALPGQKINLTISGASSPTYEWTVPEKTFYNYDPSKTSGQLVPDLEYDQALMTFYWTEGKNDERTVTCDVMVDGKAVTVAGVIKVYKPESTFKGTGGYVQPGNLSFELHGDPPFPHGMAWDESTVAVPFASGVFAFFQTGEVSRSGVTKNKAGSVTGRYRVPASASKGLDGGAPYGAEDPNGVPPWNTSAVVGRGNPPAESAGDSPRDSLVLLHPRVDLDEITVSDSYTTWLMFKPIGSDSCWVPLQTFTWVWGVTATRIIHYDPMGNRDNSIPDGMSLSSITLPGNHTGTPTTIHPQWNSKISANTATWENY